MGHKENATSTDIRAKKPKTGMEIVWRFKDSKGWRVGHVRELLGQGRIVRIKESRYATFGDDTVALTDIDWYIK